MGVFSFQFQLSASFVALNIFILGNREKVLHVHSVITFAFCNIFHDKKQEENIINKSKRMYVYIINESKRVYIIN